MKESNNSESVKDKVKHKCHVYLKYCAIQNLRFGWNNFENLLNLELLRHWVTLS
jgi:hypothetical protein